MPPRGPAAAAAPAWRTCASLPPAEVVGALGTTLAGLTRAEAARRLHASGRNEVPRPPRAPPALRLAGQLTHFLALVLWAAGALAFVAGQPQLGWTIFAVVAVNGAFGAWQEHRAERTLDALEALMPANARVVRDGIPASVPARDVVPGDVLELEAGDRVAADARIVSSTRLALDVSLLTGESLPVARDERACSAPDLASAASLAPAGATVATGRARAVVFATGPGTELGRTARLAGATRRARSPLELQVARLVRVVTAIAVGMAALVLAGLAAVGAPLHESLLFAIGILVANVPEGLLPTITVTLAGNVQRMARRKAVVTRLPAVETLGAVDVICTDKTGTITANAPVVRIAWTPELGELRPTVEEPAIRRLLVAASLAADVRLAGDAVEGDPLDAAIVQGCRAAGLDVAAVRGGARRLAERPFDAERRWTSVVVSPAPPAWAADALVVVKGAPQAVLERTAASLDEGVPRPLDEQARHRVAAACEALAARGLRVIAVAGRELRGATPGDEPEHDLALLGVLALEDPPRPGVRETLARCRRAGIAVTIVTGDHGATARAIAEEVGLWTGGWRVVEGAALDALPDDALDALLVEGAGFVFARVTPTAKLRLVHAYQRLGHVVAVTGDGVNDAPALHAAHVGIAMGRGGTDVARAAADVVLLDDDFATILAAVEEGRATFANVRKFLAYVLTSNVPEIVPFLAMVALGVPPALGILQILAIDLGTDMLPALALGAEPPEPGAMDQPPRSASARLLDAGILARSYGFLGVVEAAVSLAAYAWTWHASGYTLADVQALTPSILAHAAPAAAMETYRLATTATLAAIVACQAGNVLACRSDRAGGAARPPGRMLRAALGVELALLLAIVYVPQLRAVFATAPLPAAAWPWLALGTLVMLGADRAWKRAAAARRLAAPATRPSKA